MKIRHHGIAGLFGHANGVRVTVVTDRGVELPLGRSQGWTVAELAETVNDIEALPELEPDSRRA